MKHKSHGIFIGVLLVGLVGMISSAKGKVDAEAARDARKADYIFNESMYYYMSDRDDAFFDLAQYAGEINPQDKFLGSLTAIKSMVESRGDSAAVEKAMQMSDRYFSENADDSYMGMPYARMLYNLGKTDEMLTLVESMYERRPDNPDLMQNYIQVLAATRSDENIKKALRLCRDYEDRYGFDINTFRRKAELYSLMGDSAAVINETRRLLALSPESPLTLSIVGAIYANYNNTDTAAIYFQKAIDNDPSFSYAYMLRNTLYMATGDTASYIHSTLDAIRQLDLDEESKMGLVGDFLDKSMSSDSCAGYADTVLGYMTDAYPHNLVLRDISARFYGAKGQFDKAIESAGFAIDLDPQNPDYRSLLASLYYISGDYSRAADVAVEAFDAMPDKPAFLLTAVGSLTQAKDYKRAFSMLDRLEAATDTASHDMLSDIWLARADIYSARDSLAQASEAFDKALLFNPDNHLALNNYAYTLACKGGDLEKALDMSARSLRLSPNDMNALDTYAWVLFKKKNYAEAKEIIDDLIEIDGEPSWELFDHAGDIYFMAGYPDEAVEFWEKALDMNPENELLRRKVTHKTFFYK